MAYLTPEQQKSHMCAFIAPGRNINKQINKDFYFKNLMQIQYITKLKPRMWWVYTVTQGRVTHRNKQFWLLHSLDSGTYFRKQTEKHTTEYTCLFHAIKRHFAHSKILPCCIRRAYFTADKLWTVVLQGDYYLWGTLQTIRVGNPLSLEKVKKRYIWRKADSVSKRYLNHASGKIFRCCKACLDIGD